MADLIPSGLAASLRSDASRRFMALALLVTIVFVVWGIVQWAGSPRMVPLFQQSLGLGEAQQYKTMLDADDVRNQVVDGGSNILVPANQLARLRVEFAAQGMGWASCQEPAAFPLGSGSIEQRLQRARTIREHLNCMIAGIDGINRAQVSLTLQEASPFAQFRRPAKASVMVWPSRGTRITDETVEAIAFLVSGAVDGLEPSSVAVVNGNGGFSLQAPSDAAGSSAQSNRELAVQRGIENQLQDKVERLLAPLMDTGEFQVQVSATLDWTEIVRRSERFDPEGQAIMREENAEVPPGAAGPGSPSYTSEQIESQYSRTIEDLTVAPGSVARLSVGVLLNEGAAIFGDAAGPAGPQIRVRQLARIDSVVKAGVGYDASRGDVVAVTTAPFQVVSDSTLVAGPTGSIEGPLFLIAMLLRPVLGLLAIGLVGFLAMKIVRSPGFSMPRLAPGGTDAAAAMGGAPTAGALPSQAPNARDPVGTGVGGSLVDDPGATARVVKAWLQEA